MRGKNMFFKCICDSEAINVDVVEYGDIHKEYNFSFWEAGYSYQKILTLKDKFRWCLRIITKGIPYSDMVVLSKEEATNLKNFLDENLKEE